MSDPNQLSSTFAMLKDVFAQYHPIVQLEDEYGELAFPAPPGGLMVNICLDIRVTVYMESAHCHFPYGELDEITAYAQELLTEDRIGYECSFRHRRSFGGDRYAREVIAKSAPDLVSAIDQSYIEQLFQYKPGPMRIDFSSRMGTYDQTLYIDCIDGCWTYVPGF